MNLRLVPAISAGLACLVSIALQSSAQERKKPPNELIDGDPMYSVIPMDTIPSIDNPVFAPAEEASSWMMPDELVMGVLDAQGNARCYSTWHLDHHEIVNDVVGDVPIAAVW